LGYQPKNKQAGSLFGWVNRIILQGFSERERERERDVKSPVKGNTNRLKHTIISVFLLYKNLNKVEFKLS